MNNPDLMKALTARLKQPQGGDESASGGDTTTPEPGSIEHAPMRATGSRKKKPKKKAQTAFSATVLPPTMRASVVENTVSLEPVSVCEICQYYLLVS
jgi:hypothetical protein